MSLPGEIKSLYNLGLGTGLVVTKYPVNAAGVSLLASGKTTGVYKFAAANANVKQIVAKNIVGANFRLVWLGLDTFSATGIYIIRLGSGTGAAAAIARIVELYANEITAAGALGIMPIPQSPLVTFDGANDAILGDAASSNVGADDTVVASVGVLTGSLG